MSLKKTDTNDIHIYMWPSCEQRVGFPSNFVSFLELTVRDPYILQICNKRSLICGILKLLFLCCISKENYRQENKTNVMTFHFKLKNSSNHIVLFLLNSIDMNEERFLIFFFKIKRKKTAFHHFQNHHLK